MTSIILYPKTIKTTTGRSTRYHTQQLTNPQALCNDSPSLAYWGVKTPLFVGNYLRNYPDSLTSKAGSYNTPEVFFATFFDTQQASSKSIVKKITVEYKYEQISYSSPTAYGKFTTPKISLIKDNKTLNTITGALPEKNRYNNNKINPDKNNTNYANLKTLHSHILYESNNDTFTIEDLKKTQIKFIAPTNTSNNHLRMVMQFIRLKVDFEEHPLCRTQLYIEESKSIVNKTYHGSVIVKTTNEQFNQTKIKIDLPSDTEITDFNTNYGNSESYYDKETQIWYINKINTESRENILKNYAQLHFEAKSSQTGKHTITSTLLNNQDSIEYTSADDITINSDILKFSIETNKDIYQINNLFILKVTVDNPSPSENNKIIIDTQGIVTKKTQWNIDLPMTYLDNGKWEVQLTNKQYVFLKAEVDQLTKSGDITIKGEYYTYDSIIRRQKHITIFDNPLDKEYFKIRLEDGSDVRYNSLLFTEGDDLTIPLTYDISDDNTQLLKDLKIIGETKRIPIGETDIINFTLSIDSKHKISYENILASIEVIDKNGKSRNDIIIGSTESVNILDINNPKYFIIDQLSSEKKKNIGFMVESENEDICIIKIKILNEDKYDTLTWTPSKIFFKDAPNVKMTIDGIDDLIYESEEDNYFTLYYKIQNQSDIDGKNLKFKIIEPAYFEKIKKDNDYEIFINGTQLNEYNNKDCLYDIHSGIWTFPELPKHSKEYILSIKYKAKKTGIYDFIIKTVDNPNIIEDDQIKNEYIHTLMVNISTNVNITTTVSNPNPFVDDLIDFTITIENYTKPQKHFTFTIEDIGDLTTKHNIKHYNIMDVHARYGTFTPDNTSSTKIGVWELKNIGKNKKYILVLSLKCIDTGTHTIKTNFTDNYSISDQYTNRVNIVEKNQRINFDVYHAVGDNCNDCNSLTQICDDDFIPIGDDFFYVFKITNNERNTIKNLTVNARMDKSFLNYNQQTKSLDSVLCSSEKYNYNEETGLISFLISEIKKCETKTFCIHIKPSKIGVFYSNFILTTKNSNVLHKKLKLTVNSLFSERKLTHELTLYNFEKTNRYFRYEIDGTANIFKFFNKGDKSLKMIDTEYYKKSALETYKGTNLRQLYRDIEKNSIYVEPTFLRTGNNKLMDKGYELYPDGFIRRFGLLKSEVFHYTGQLPKISNLIDYAMRWDIDNWSTKVWTGGIYSNGIFDLTVDYSKIPTNFNVLEKNKHPIASLQGLVDRVKPFGTKGICYYSATTYLDVEIDVQINISEVITKASIEFDIDKNIGIISWYNRHDDSLAITYDLIRIYIQQIKTNIKNNIANIKNNTTELPKPKTEIKCDVYDDTISKQYINECNDIIIGMKDSNEIINFDIIQNLTNIFLEEVYNSFNSSYKIADAGNDFSNTIKSTASKIDTNINNYIFTFDNKTEILDNTKFGIFIENEKNCIQAVRYKNSIDNFNGFKIFENNTEIGSINFNEDIYNFKILMQIISENNINYIHFSAEINNSNIYYHFGVVEDYQQNFINYGIICLKDEEVISDTEYFFTSLKTYNNKIPIEIGLSKYPKTIIKDYEQIIDNSGRWDGINKITTSNHEYALFKNDIKIDKECKKNNTLVKPPKIILKYNTNDIDSLAEIEDIKLKLEAQSNKENFLTDSNINFYLNGDYYIPQDNIIKKRYYPQNISNVNRIFTPTMFIHKPNITICNNCLKTSRGLYSSCQYCGSKTVTHVDHKLDATFCHNCGWIDTGWSKGQIDKIYATDTSYCTKCGNIDVGIKKECSECGAQELLYFDYKNNITYCTCCKDHSSNERVEYNTVSRCNHCLSTDIERIKIDFNKTYCNDCNKTSNDYYNACPYCFSTNVTHLNYAGDSYKFVENDEVTQILDDSFVIQSPIRRVKLMSIDLPLNNHMPEINELKELTLSFIGENHNDGYSYCNSCGKISLGKYDKCPYCDNTLLEHHQDNNIVMEVFCKIGNTWESVKLDNNSLNSSHFEKTIDLLSLVKKNPYDTLYLYIYLENLNFNKQEELLAKYDISDEDKQKILMMDIEVNQIKPSSHYYNELEWDLSSFYGDFRHGIKYEVPVGRDSTDYIMFDDFNIKKNQNTKKVILNIDGFNKSYQHSLLYLQILTDKSIYHIEDYITYGLFNYSFDLLTLIPYNEINNKIKIKMQFKNTQPLTNIIITNVNINTIANRKNNITPTIQPTDFNYIKKHHQYNIQTTNLWGLKTQLPKHLSGIELKNNLICAIEFDKLDIDEYIKFYNAQLIIQYKSKCGEYHTEYITPIHEKNNTELITGNVIHGDGEFIGTIQDTNINLNNLEYQIDTKDRNQPNFIALNKEIYQSFIATSTSINGITLDTLGRNGYPSQKIEISIYNNKNMHPLNMLTTKKINGWNKKEKIYIDIEYNDLTIGETYWIVIKDIKANDNNYYKIKCNKNLEVGQLITKNKTEKIEDSSINFATHQNTLISNYYDLPTNFYLDNNKFRINHLLYRYNTNNFNKFYTTNLKIKRGIYYD